ncbi:hypothetical protein [Nonomuraea salmonea]|uniref:hypothetical protein n=1 Tax=Nonomuraea salmonea TaxID=46181 RepID=UPI0031EF5B81
MTTKATGSRIISVLEQAWLAVRAQHPEVPDVVVITGAGSEGAWMTWGHFNASRWRRDGRATPEMFASGELLGLGGRRVMEVLLHEAAHALAAVRGIEDVTSSNRYHNRAFLRLASEMGLKGPRERDKTIGWSACVITDATADRYRDTIKMLDAEKLPYVDHPSVAAYRQWMAEKSTGEAPAAGDAPDDDQGGQGEGEEDAPEPLPRLPRTPKGIGGSGTGRNGTRIKVGCGCRSTWVTYAFWDCGGITCDACGEAFDEVGSTS